MKPLAPEEIELNKKRAVLERLKDRLADREEEMTDLRAELEQFEAKYTMEVGRLYAELDDIDAQIAEEEYRLYPDDEEMKAKAEEARRRAEESASKAGDGEACDFKWKPTVEAKKAYHNLARLIHPDLAFDNEERERRHGLMAQLNDAYSSGDQGRLNKLVEDFRDSPDLVRGDTVGDELVRAIRQIAQVKNRLKELKAEMNLIEISELFTLREKVNAEMKEGRNLLKHMAGRTRSHIMKNERRLANLREANAAVVEDIKERYGIDVSAFK
jgi:predicted nuclease with TOPRIM domain